MTSHSALDLFEQHFSSLRDPRDSRGLLHTLKDILIIAILAIICGADEFTEMEDFGHSKKAFLSSFLELPNGIPSHDTFGRVFQRLCPQAFSRCFAQWVKSICKLNGDIINIDGKALRRSFDTGSDKSMIYMVSAWANKNNLVLGQVKVADKSNEITAIPKLLDLLDVTGSLITIDAMGTQKEIAAQIVDKKADYLLALKGNQSGLHEEVEQAFTRFGAKKQAHTDTSTQLDHGRIEQRTAFVVAAQDFLSPDELRKWKNIRSIVCLEAYVTYKNGKQEGREDFQRRYYITSLEPDAVRINQAIISHWGIETKVHWILDVAFREDESRVRKGFADQNFAIARHIALNKLKNEASHRRGVKNKRKKAGWDEQYLLRVLAA